MEAGKMQGLVLWLRVALSVALAGAMMIFEQNLPDFVLIAGSILVVANIILAVR